MSLADPDVLSAKALDEVEQAEKVGSMTSRQTSENDDRLSNFDIDTFSREYRTVTKKGKKEHVFGRAEASRGEWVLSQDNERDPHDRFDSEPALQR